MAASHKVRSCVAATGTVFALLVSTTEVAQADDQDVVTAAETAGALADVPGLLTQSDTVVTKSDVDSAAVSATPDITVDIPRDAASGVAITNADGTTLSLGLPGTDATGAGKVVAAGTVAYPSGEGAATAVQVLEQSAGVRALTVIDSADAPTTYTYELDVPLGGRVVQLDTGGAEVRDADDTIVTVIDRPWAKDASGMPVNTHYEIFGNKVTQVVEHQVPGVSYPVTADPAILVGPFVVAFTFVMANALRSCGKSALAGAAYQALIYGWVWREIVRTGRDSCVIGALGGFRGFVKRW